MVVSCYSPQTGFPPPLSTVRELLLHYHSFPQMRETHLLKHLQVLGLFAFLLHHLSSTWELS